MILEIDPFELLNLLKNKEVSMAEMARRARGA
jgi:hypothetical protein